MFYPLETKGNIQQPEMISSVDLLDMNCDTKVHTIDYLKLQIDDPDPFTCNASILSPINVQNQSRKNCDDKTENEGIDCNSTFLVANQTFLDALLCAVDAQLPDHDFDKSLDFSKDNIKYLQRNDDNLVPIISYLKNGALPRLQKDVRRLLLTAPDYCLNDGILYHSRVAKSKRTQEMTVFQLFYHKLSLPKF